MKGIMTSILVTAVLATNAQEKFQLAPPMLKYNSTFFSDSTSFEIVFNQPGAAVHYTLTGKEPSSTDPVYTGRVPITKNTLVCARAIGNEYLSSEVVTASFFKQGLAIKNTSFSKPADYYANAKPNTLHDNVGGQVNYRSGGWIGFDSDTAVVLIELVKKEKVSAVYVDLLQDEPSWIFLPEQILLYYYDDRTKGYLPVAKEMFSATSPSPKNCHLRKLVPDKDIRTDKLKIEFHVLKRLPDWHSGKGKHAWFFIDEVKVY